MVLDQMREENAIVEPVDRPADMDDEVQVNVKGTVNEEVVVDEDDIKVVFSINHPFLSMEFQEALLGISKDEERTFTIPLPNEMESEELRGAETVFTVKATQVSGRTLPGLDDAFASTVGAFETLEALQQDVYDRILQSKQQQTQETYRNELVEMLVEPAEVHYPPLMVSEMLDEMVEETETRMQRERQMSLEDTLRLEGRTLDQFREELTSQAENRVKTSLVLAEFARVEETAVTDDDVVQEYQGFFSNLNLGSEMEMPSISLDSELARNIRSTILGRKALERLEQIARGLADEEDEGAADNTDEDGGAEDNDAVDDSGVEDTADADVLADDVVEDNGAEDNAVTEDSTAESVDDSGTEDSGAEDSGAEDSGAEDSGAEDSGAEDSADESKTED
jgi:trigger factor